MTKWQAAVKEKYPQFAKKIQFKGRVEGDKNMVCAEIRGMDRCFGVWDMDKEEGIILEEKWKFSLIQTLIEADDNQVENNEKDNSESSEETPPEDNEQTLGRGLFTVVIGTNEDLGEDVKKKAIYRDVKIADAQTLDDLTSLINNDAFTEDTVAYDKITHLIFDSFLKTDSPDDAYKATTFELEFGDEEELKAASETDKKFDAYGWVTPGQGVLNSQNKFKFRIVIK